MTELPLVSVLMTAYNREKYIAEAIKSVLDSSFTDFELIIVDDCSVDKTVSIASSYAAKDKRIRIFENVKNLGDYANRNKAASYARGHYLMHCDSDDKLLVDGIKQCVEVMLNFPTVEFGMYQYNFKPDAVPVAIHPDEAIRKHFFEHPFLSIGPGGTILTKSFFNEIKGYPEKYGPSNDMYFNLKCVCKTSILLLPFDFMFYRRHDQQEINNAYSYLINNYAYLRDALNELPLPLSADEIKWLREKNNRRFATNILKFFRNTRSFSKTRKAIRDARFTFTDFLQGIFHL